MYDDTVCFSSWSVKVNFLFRIVDFPSSCERVRCQFRPSTVLHMFSVLSYILRTICMKFLVMQDTSFFLVHIQTPNTSQTHLTRQSLPVQELLGFGKPSIKSSPRTGTRNHSKTLLFFPQDWNFQSDLWWYLSEFNLSKEVLSHETSLRPLLAPCSSRGSPLVDLGISMMCPQENGTFTLCHKAESLSHKASALLDPRSFLDWYSFRLDHSP